jgi:hypothetical protein
MSRTTRKQPEWILYGTLNATSALGAPIDLTPGDADTAGADEPGLQGASAHILQAEQAGGARTVHAPRRSRALPCRP